MIRKLLEWILGIEFSLCKHEFELVKEAEVFSGREGARPTSIRFLYFCKKCGKDKVIDV